MLSSFLLALVDEKHAYHAGRSCDSALMMAQRALKEGRAIEKSFTTAVSLDVSGAFDNLPFDTVGVGPEF